MRQINIATAPNRATKQWKNHVMQWSELVERCGRFLVTNETVTEYARMPREQQSNIKDVGGFVGGYLTDGKRNKHSVKFRDVICLDIDNGKAGVWEKVSEAMVGTESFVYSTHKHTDKVPRLRLVVLLDRSVSPDEYQAISRAVAKRVGFEFFDPTTYAPERLMYWPSRSCDGDEFYHSISGSPLCADDMLATYTDWRDTSNWDESTIDIAWKERESKKQGDPCEKPGIVGCFCRTYDIHAAIAQFLPEVYEEAGENRYTYKNGTVSAGLVLYGDGKFAYSHNATDPCSQHLVNAFDLVRIHKFSERDEAAAPGTPINKLPSYLAMQALATTDTKVKRQAARERLASAKDDFADVTVRGDGMLIDENGNEVGMWTDRMLLDKNSNYRNCPENTFTVLTYAPEFAGKIWFNDFTGFFCVDGELPWGENKEGHSAYAWKNSDDSQLRVYLQIKYGQSGKDRIYDTLVNVAFANRKHPVKDFLLSLKWDKVPRLEALFIDFLGARDTKATRAFTRKHFIAAVARMLRFNESDAKYDQILTLEGPEGIGKSTILRKLAGSEWFNDSVYSLDGKDGMEGLQGSWLVEVAELVAVKKSENEAIKSFLSREVDKFRPAYGRRVETRPRECVFFATTNEKSFLKGDTGNRRYWVIETGAQPATKDVFRDLDENYRQQVWAEAVSYYLDGESRLVDPDVLQEAKALQEAYNEASVDERIGVIKEFLDKRLPADWKTRSIARRKAYFRDSDPLEQEGVVRRDTVSNVEIYVECFGMDLNRKNLRYETREISSLMARVDGWEKAGTAFLGSIYGKQRVYKRIVKDDEDEDL